MIRANSRSDHDTPVTERILQDKTKKAPDNQDIQFLDSVLESSLPFTGHPGSIICSHFVLGYKKELYAVTEDTGFTPPECESGVKVIEELHSTENPQQNEKESCRDSSQIPVFVYQGCVKGTTNYSCVPVYTMRKQEG